MRMELSGQNLVWRHKVVPIKLEHIQFSCSVESNSLWPHGRQGPSWRSMPGLPVYHQFLELTQTHVHWVGDRWTISSSVVPFSFYLQSFSASGSFPMSQFSSDGQSMFSFSISPSNEHPGMISFRMDWLDLLAVQGTLKSLLQHHSSKASILWHSACFIVQLSHPYMTTGKEQAHGPLWIEKCPSAQVIKL